MRKLLRHPVTKPLVHGVLQLVVFAMWAEGGLQWLLPRIASWAARQAQGLPPWAALLMAACLGGVAGLAIFSTIRLPVIVLELAEQAVRWRKSRGGRA